MNIMKHLPNVDIRTFGQQNIGELEPHVWDIADLDGYLTEDTEQWDTLLTRKKHPSSGKKYYSGQMAEEYIKPDGVIVALFMENKAVGFAHLKPAVDYVDTVEISSIVIHPDHQGKGLGTLLIEAAYERATLAMPGAKYVTLSVSANNNRAMNMYRKEGFEPVGVYMARSLK